MDPFPPGLQDPVPRIYAIHNSGLPQETHMAREAGTKSPQWQSFTGTPAERCGLVSLSVCLA
jgi:hypothetical protein